MVLKKRSKSKDKEKAKTKKKTEVSIDVLQSEQEKQGLVKTLEEKKAIFDKIKGSNLTPREKLFIHEYFKSFDPFQAYEKVGYEGKQEDCDALFFSEKIQDGVKQFLTMPSMDMQSDSLTNIGITEELVTKLEMNAELGMPIDKIAKLSGVPLSTFKAWLEKGQDQEKSGEIDRPHYKLMFRFKSARIRGERDRIEAIIKTGYGGEEIRETKRVTKPNGNVEETVVIKKTNRNWQALAWSLERQYPDYYSKQDKLKIESFNDTAKRIKEELDLINLSIPEKPERWNTAAERERVRKKAAKAKAKAKAEQES